MTTPTPAGDLVDRRLVRPRHTTAGLPEPAHAELPAAGRRPAVCA